MGLRGLVDGVPFLEGGPDVRVGVELGVLLRQVQGEWSYL